MMQNGNNVIDNLTSPMKRWLAEKYTSPAQQEQLASIVAVDLTTKYHTFNPYSPESNEEYFSYRCSYLLFCSSIGGFRRDQDSTLLEVKWSS